MELQEGLLHKMSGQLSSHTSFQIKLCQASLQTLSGYLPMLILLPSSSQLPMSDVLKSLCPDLDVQLIQVAAIGKSVINDCL